MKGFATVEDFMSYNHISLQLKKIDGWRENRSARKGRIDYYRCRLSRAGKQVEVFVAAGPDQDLLTPSDVLIMLVFDASSCEMLKEYYGRRRQLEEVLSDSNQDVGTWGEFWQEYESRCKQIQKLKAFLGLALYRELVVRFGIEY